MHRFDPPPPRKRIPMSHKEKAVPKTGKWLGPTCGVRGGGGLECGGMRTFSVAFVAVLNPPFSSEHSDKT